ncbi:MAG: hypothetical protein ACRDUY_13865 [Nitriliruptorales bacterium]
MTGAGEARTDLAETLGAATAVLGTSMCIAPGIVSRIWTGDASPAPKVIARALGARDLALGFGLYTAARRGRPTRGWAEGLVLATAGDAVATLLHWRHLPRAGRWLVLATSLSAAGMFLSIARNPSG